MFKIFKHKQDKQSLEKCSLRSKQMGDIITEHNHISLYLQDETFFSVEGLTPVYKWATMIKNRFDCVSNTQESYDLKQVSYTQLHTKFHQHTPLYN